MRTLIKITSLPEDRCSPGKDHRAPVKAWETWHLGEHLPQVLLPVGDQSPTPPGILRFDLGRHESQKGRYYGLGGASLKGA